MCFKGFVVQYVERTLMSIYVQVELRMCLSRLDVVDCVVETKEPRVQWPIVVSLYYFWCCVETWMARM